MTNTISKRICNPFYILQQIAFLHRQMQENTNPPLYVRFDKLKCIFISAPKNANSTINAMLFTQEGYPFDVNDYNSIHVEKKKYLVNTNELIQMRENYFIFSFVRNPFERVVSCYKNKIQEENHSLKSGYFGIFTPQMTFEDFVNKISMIPDVFSEIHFRSQYSFLFHKNRPLYHYIGRVEYFDRDITPIINHFDLTYTKDMNVSQNKKNWKEYYTPQIAEKVYNRYIRDFEVFDYTNIYDELLDHLNA